MKARVLGSVTLPRVPRSGTDILMWAGEVNTTCQQLRDRIVDVKTRPNVASPALPLQIVKGSAADKFRVTPGYVNLLMPTLSSVLLNNDPPPEITVTADIWVYAKVVGTFGTPDTYVVTIVTEITDVVPTGTAITATGFTSFFKIGQVDFTSGSPDTYEIINQHGGGNLGVDSWGLYNLWWRY